MCAGTLSIVRAGLKPATYEVRFVRHNGARASGAALALPGPESLHPFLDSIGVPAREREDAVRDAILNGEAVIFNVTLSQEFIDLHGL